MPFRPNVNDILTIEGTRYIIAEHPSAPGMPYGQTGRRATVYKLASNRDIQALKVFTQAFRVPRIAESVDQLRPFARLSGLQVCNRRVLTPQRYSTLLSQQPDLTYAVLMPWVQGYTWQEIVLEGQPCTPQQSRALACSLARVLATMEQQGIAHCDLSGPNVMVMGNAEHVALIDVEEMYGPGLSRPDKLPAGSAGYAHRTAPAGVWSADADRFAGAVLLAEMLGWCDERVCHAAYEEQFFDPDEMQQNGERYTLMFQVLRDRWGRKYATTFARAWHSATLGECPSLTEWAQLLLEEEMTDALELPVAPQVSAHAGTHTPLPEPPTPAELDAANQTVRELEDAYRLAPQVVAITYARALLNRGGLKERAGKPGGALQDYQTALAMVPAGTLRDELATAMQQLTTQHASAQQGLPLPDMDGPQPLLHSDVGAATTTESAPAGSSNGISSFEPAGEQQTPAQQQQVLQLLITIAITLAILIIFIMLAAAISSIPQGASSSSGSAARAAQAFIVPSTSELAGSPTATRAPTATPTDRPGPTRVRSPTMARDERTLAELKQRGSLIAVEDFADNRNNWYIGEASNGRAWRSIRDGVYVMQLSQEGIRWWETWYTQEWNFIAQVDVAALTEGSGGGIIFGYQDYNNYYSAEVSADGDYRVLQKFNNEWTRLAGWRHDAAINRGIETNTVTVVRQGSMIQLYVNDVLVEELEHNTHRSGEVGIMANSGRSSNAEVLLDNFYLWRLP